MVDQTNDCKTESKIEVQEVAQKFQAAVTERLHNRSAPQLDEYQDQQCLVTKFGNLYKEFGSICTANELA